MIEMLPMNTLLLKSAILLIGLGSCLMACDQSDQELINPAVLDRLYLKYQHGEIASCQYDNQTVYHCTLNAYDTGSVIYDLSGKVLGHCSYLETLSDSICDQIEDCRVIYRTTDAITGQPPVDEYHLVNKNRRRFFH